jgi:hypothetical protein
MGPGPGAAEGLRGVESLGNHRSLEFFGCRPQGRAGLSVRSPLPPAQTITPRTSLTRAVLCLGAAALFWAPEAAVAANSIDGTTAVSSRVFGGYTRVRLPDGSLKPETYAFGNGGFVASGAAGGGTSGASRDQSIDNLGFNEIAAAMQAPLSAQNYALSQDPNTTNLLIMVFWGTTVGGYHEKKGKFRDILDLKNAQLLGFDSESTFSQSFGNNIGSNIQKQLHAVMMNALEVNRYFVILRAFDFQSSWKEKKLKLLWESRFSINQRNNAFNEALPLMAQYASPNFGQDSAGLQLARVSEGRVLIGDITTLDPGAGK